MPLALLPPAPRSGYQPALLGECANRERIAPAVARLQVAFGANTVRRASEAQVPRRVRFLRAISAVAGWM